jgi:hypothetical protein
LTEQLATATASVTTLTADLATANATVTTLTADLATANAATATLQGTYDALVASNATLQAAYDALANPAPASITLTSSSENVSVQLTTGNDTITAANGTLGAGDVIADPSATDSDAMVVTHSGATLASTGVISNVENITINAASTSTFTVTDASGITGGAVTVNLTTPGGASQATISDIGSNTTVTAGERVATLIVDTGADRSDLTVVGGTGATTVNGSANKLTTATIDASAGTSVDVEFGAESSGITITAGSTTVDINDGTKAEVSNLTLNASTATTVTADFDDDSSNINLTTGTGAVAIGAGGEAGVNTGLVIDASASEAAVAVNVLDGSDVTLTVGSDSTGITVDSTSTAATTDDGSSITITADAADIGSGITDFDTVNLTLNGTASTVTLDDSVYDLTVSATAAAQTVQALTESVDGTITLNGAYAINLEMDPTDVDGTDTLTVVSDGAADHILELKTNAQAADTDLTGVDTDVDIQFNVAMAAAGTGEFTLANGATVLFETAQTNNLGFTAAAANSTATVDITTANNAGVHAFTNMATLTITADGDNSNAHTFTVDSDTAGTQGAIAVTGSKDITLSGSTDASSVDASAMTGDLTATLSATVDTITGGAGDDTFTAYNGDFTVDGGAGDDTLNTGAVDFSDDTVSISNVEVINVATNSAVFLQGQLGGTETITGTTGTLEIEGAATDDTINLSGFANGLTQAVDGTGLLIIDSGAGADTLTGSSSNDLFLAGAGADTIVAGNGQDNIVGGTGGDTIDLTETSANSVADFVGYTALTDWAASVGAAGGTFSGHDVISGFRTTSDQLRFDAGFTDGDTSAIVAVADRIIAAADVSASTAASTALNDLSAAEFTDVDSVLAYINDASVMGGTFTYTGGADELLAVTDATSGSTAIYHVDSADTTITATEVSLVAVVDAILVSGDIDIA